MTLAYIVSIVAAIAALWCVRSAWPHVRDRIASYSRAQRNRRALGVR